MIRRRVVRVPASSGNLGPGFDCMAAALSLHLELEVTETGEFSVQSDLPLSTGRDNLCVQAFERLHPPTASPSRSAPRSRPRGDSVSIPVSL